MPATITQSPKEPARHDSEPLPPDTLPVDPDEGPQTSPLPEDVGRERERELEPQH